MCTLTIFMICDLQKQINRISNANVDYRSQLEVAVKNFESVESDGNLRDLSTGVIGSLMKKCLKAFSLRMLKGLAGR